MRAGKNILCLNSGSSSLKFALYRMERGEGETLLARGAAEEIRRERGRLWVEGEKGRKLLDKKMGLSGHDKAVRALFGAWERLQLPAPHGVGHRIVHGGPKLTAHTLIDEALLRRLRDCVPFAPLHLPGAIRAIEGVMARFPHLPQAACFDTAFHRGMPERAKRFPLAEELRRSGVYRYGFHGLSYEYLVERLHLRQRGRAVMAHLGNGASLAAVMKGEPRDTTMGFTPSGGLPMGTRSGDLDPGLLLYLLREKGYTPQGLERLVNREGGLLGISGSTSDMKALLEREKEDSRAALAVEVFSCQTAKQIGAMAVALGGLEVLVFSGGIGEKAGPVRGRICKSLAFVGVELDEGANRVDAEVISSPGSAVEVLVVPTREELMLARHTRRMLM